jgi:hypothetical protein
MPYQIAGIDGQKKMLAVVADVEVDSECQFQRRKVGTSPAELRALKEGSAAFPRAPVAVSSRTSGIGSRSSQNRYHHAPWG